MINLNLTCRRCMLFYRPLLNLNKPALNQLNLPYNQKKHLQTTSSHKNDKYTLDTTSFSIEDIPKPAVQLGFGGVLPFVSMAMASGIFHEPYYINMIALGQLSYAACILTFLGGVHWGKEIIQNPKTPCFKTLTISVIPSLYAWSAFIMPYHLALYYLSFGLVSMAIYDVNQTSFPSWYRKLRVPLTVLAATSVAVTGYNLS